MYPSKCQCAVLLMLFAYASARGVYTLPMYGNINQLQTYYIKIGFGTPPQSFNVLVDTGSTDLLLPSSNCTTCTQATHLYNAAASSTSSKVNCNGKLVSSDGSVVVSQGIHCDYCFVEYCGIGDVYGGGGTLAAGFVASDTISVAPGLTTDNVVFNEVFFESVGEGQGPFLPKPIDGLIGLAYSSNSETGSPSFFDLLVREGKLDDVFSHCLSENGGQLVLGGLNDAYYSGPIAYTPIIHENFYAINTTNVFVGDVSLGLPYEYYNRDYTIVDSGTAQLIVPPKALAKIKSLMVSNCSSNALHGVCDVSHDQTIFDGECFAFTQQQVEAYPPITMEFHRGIRLPLDAQYYLIPSASKPGHRCLGIIALDGYDGTAVGDVFLQAYYTVYDRANARMGFAPVKNCHS